MNWFQRITGFDERSYAETQNLLQVLDGRLHSPYSDRRPRVGTLVTPSLAELRREVDALPSHIDGSLRFRCLAGDAWEMHRDPAHADAVFQVASQFNLLEMVAPSVTPEDGVTRYINDRTQGPACARAAGAATIFRNYLVEVDGMKGQSRYRQIDCLQDLGRALSNGGPALWRMENGYALPDARQLKEIDKRLQSQGASAWEALKGLLRIGVHSAVEVTAVEPEGHCVTQAFCSALPIAYANHSALSAWKRFASLILEAAYEATLLAAVLNAHETGCRRVFLTRIGAGVFGNDVAWVHAAILKALQRVQEHGLDVAIVTFSEPDASLQELVASFTPSTPTRRRLQ